jgi:hypothetical protein
MDLVDQRRGGLATRRSGDQRAHVVSLEPGQRDGGGLRHQRHHQRPQRVVGRLDLGVAVGADQQEPLEPGVLRDELEQPQRGRVGPVQVVEHHDEGTPLGDGHQGRGDRVVDLERVAGFVDVDVAQHDGEAGAGRLVCRRPVVGRAAQAPQDLHPRPVARRAVGRPTGPADHERTTAPRVVGRPGDQRRLADAGLAGDEHQTAVAVGRPLDLRAQEGDGVLPPDECLADPRRHGP